MNVLTYYSKYFWCTQTLYLTYFGELNFIWACENLSEVIFVETYIFYKVKQIHHSMLMRGNEL